MPYLKIALHGAIVAVTGGARGVGKATASPFTSKGATVCVGDLDPASADAILHDVTSHESFRAFIDRGRGAVGRGPGGVPQFRGHHEHGAPECGADAACVGHAAGTRNADGRRR